MKTTKPFILDGEEFGTVCHYGSQNGPLIIDLNMESLSISDAQRLSKWLLTAIEEVRADRKLRKKSGNFEGEEYQK